MFAGIAVICLFMAGPVLLELDEDLYLASFVLAPIFGGLVAAYYWRNLGLGLLATWRQTLFLTIIGLIAAAVFLGEGIICLIILSPLLYFMILIGTLLGRVIFRKARPKVYLLVFPSLAFAVMAEPGLRRPEVGVLTDVVTIKAAPEKVWKEITSFPDIPTPPEFWLFKLGLPYPEATTVTGDFVGAHRECIFSHGMIFKERVAELIPNEKLTFDIVEAPRHPELVGHLDMHRGQFVLRKNADGTTTLAGTTWYTVRVRPLWYFDLWTKYVFRAVHLRVMEDVKRRAES